MKNKKTKYDDIRDRLNTFDVLNCKTGKFSWNPLKLIAAIFWRLVGHTAMVYRCRETNQLFVYESTRAGRADNLTGVQLRPMREWLLAYQKQGTVSVRLISFAHGHNRDTAEDRCVEHIRRFRGTEYPDLKTASGLMYVANSVIDPPWPFSKWFKNKMTTMIMFCTMLYMHTLLYCGLIGSSVRINPSEAEPDDTLDTSNYLEAVLGAGITIGPDIFIEV